MVQTDKTQDQSNKRTIQCMSICDLLIKTADLQRERMVK